MYTQASDVPFYNAPMDRKHEDVYKTKDIYIAAYLIALNIPFLGKKEDSSFYWFMFDKPVVCEQVESSYWSGKAEVNIVDYVNAFKFLKGYLYNRGVI